jgi:IS30 family transposase
MELGVHKAFITAMSVDVFFTAPRRPWQRGTNENTNNCCANTCQRDQPVHL